VKRGVKSYLRNNSRGKPIGMLRRWALFLEADGRYEIMIYHFCMSPKPFKNCKVVAQI
jgi:hypothetical protein